MKMDSLCLLFFFFLEENQEEGNRDIMIKDRYWINVSIYHILCIPYEEQL